MRTVQLTFTFADDEWDDLREACRAGRQEPTFANVCCLIKLLAIAKARDVIDEGEALDEMWKEAMDKTKKMSGVRKC